MRLTVSSSHYHGVGFALLELLIACALIALLAGSSVQVILWQADVVHRDLQQPQPQLELQNLALQVGRDLVHSRTIEQLDSASLQRCYVISTVTDDHIGYRLRDGALQYHGDAFDCAQRGWQSLSAPHSLYLTQFDIQVAAHGYRIVLGTADDHVQLPLFTPHATSRNLFDEQLYDAPSVTDWHTCIDHALCRGATEFVITTLRLAMATVPTTATARL